MSIGNNKVKNKVLRQNHFYYYSRFWAAPLILKKRLQLTEKNIYYIDNL